MNWQKNEKKNKEKEINNLKIDKNSISTNHTNYDFDLISILENDNKVEKIFDSEHKKIIKDKKEEHRKKSNSSTLSLKSSNNLQLKYRLQKKIRNTPNLLKELESSRDEIYLINKNYKNSFRLFYSNLWEKINEKNFEHFVKLNSGSKLSIFSKIIKL